MTRDPGAEFDLQHRPELDNDPLQEFLKFRETDPFWCDDEEGFWVFTRYDAVREIQRDFFTFTHSQPPAVRDLEYPLMPSRQDPPYSVKLRAVVLPMLTPARVRALSPRVHEVSRELVAEIAPRGRCDAIEAFARKFPIKIFGEMFGLDEERHEEFRLLAEDWQHDHSLKTLSWTKIRAIIRDEIEKRRTHPRDDMLSGIGNADFEGGLIDMDIAVNLASTVFLGGLDTLPSIFGWSLRYLAQHPEDRRRLIAEPDLMASAVEEFLRVFAPVGTLDARALKDTHFFGADIKKGDRIVSLIAAANNDSSVFENPTEVIIDRSRNPHLSFGPGAHRCLGSHLARHELAIGLTEWLKEIPNFRMTPGEKVQFTGGVYALRNLPLEWDV